MGTTPAILLYAMAGTGLALAISVVVYDVIAWRRIKRRRCDNKRTKG
jgi:hypothetical protein